MKVNQQPALPGKKYNYPAAFLLYHALFAAIFGSVILLSLFGLLSLLVTNTKFLVAEPNAATFLQWLIEGIVILLGAAVINAIPLLLVIGLLTAYPSLNLTEKGYQIRIFWYKSRWLAWDTLLGITAFYPTRDLLYSNRRLFGIDSTHESYMISAAGLGRTFWLNGLLYGMGRPTFCISPFITDYHTLMQTLREKRPDLFYQ